MRRSRLTMIYFNWLCSWCATYVFVLFLFSFGVQIEGLKKNYTGYSIIRIPYKELHLLGSGRNELLEDKPDVLWLDSTHPNSTHAYVRVKNSHITRKSRVARSANNPYYIGDAQLITDNLQDWLDSREYLMYDASSNLESMGDHLFQSILVPSYRLDKYQTLAQVYAYLDEISRLDRIKVFDIGLSHEGRAIKGVEINNSPGDKNVIFIDGCTHSREWITVATAIFIIEQIIVTGVKKNFVIVPIINVDGYDYTWTTDRLWRKNRRPYQSSLMLNFDMPDRCNGVDLNRNWDINFAGEGSSKNPCSFLYTGPGPFSEPEVRAVGDLLWSLRSKIKFYLSLHSFNQLWACPHAFTKQESPHYHHHMHILRDVENAVFNTNGVKYNFGPLSTSLYVGSGFAMDWVYSRLGIVDSYLVELRDKGKFGFLLPEDQIIPTASETWQGLLVAIGKIFGDI